MNIFKTGAAVLVLIAAHLFAANDAAKLPSRDVREFHCSDGAVLLSENVPSSEVVNISLLIRTGSSTEGNYAGSGVTHLLEHLIFKGEGEKNLASVVEGAGGYTNAHTSRDETFFSATLPAAVWKSVFPLFIKAVFAPSFTRDDFEKEREVVLRELARNDDEPSYVAGRDLWETAYLVHPYRYPIGGYPGALAQLLHEDVWAYHAARYVPLNAVIAVAGPVVHRDVRDLAEKALASFPSGILPMVTVPPEPDQISPRERKAPFSTDLAYLDFAWHITPAAHADTPAFDCLAIITGQGKTSRLYRALVETGLACDVSAGSYTPRYPGLFSVSATCVPEKAGEVRRRVMEEIGRLTGGVSRRELSDAKNGLRAQLLSGLETVENRTTDLAVNYAVTGTALYSNDYLAAVGAVTADDVRRAARTCLSPQGCTFSMIARDESAPETSLSPAASRPAVTKTLLPNGIPLLFLEDPALPIVTFSMFCKGGMLYERPETNGLFSMMATLLTDGTERHSGREIAETVASWGGSLAPFSGNNSFGFSLTVPSGYRNEAFRLFSEICREPSFPEEELRRRKDERLVGITARDEDTFSSAMITLRGRLFSGHPYGLPEGGTKESVGGITRDALVKTYRSFCAAGNVVITAFGDIGGFPVRNEAERLFGSLPVFTPPELPSLRSFAAPSSDREIVKRKEAVVLVGFPGLSVGDQRRPVLELLSELLNHQDGVLFQRLREKEPLVYACGFSHFLGLQPGMIFFYAQCRPDKVERVRTVFAEAAASLREDLLDAAQIERVRTKVLGTAKIGRQTLASRAFDAGLSELYGLGFDFSQRMEKELGGVGAGQLRNFAREFFAPGREAVVIAAP